MFVIKRLLRITTYYSGVHNRLKGLFKVQKSTHDKTSNSISEMV